MNKLSTEELQDIFKKHKLWIAGDEKGRRANLRGANLREANLRGADLCGADLCRADLRGANLYGADLCGADLCGADLCRADLCRADLRGANLCEADLCRADLCGADLCRANLREANLYGANLRGANLREADLREANLCEADLCRADLCGADLCRANLREANLYGANLYGADLRNCNYNYLTVGLNLSCPETGSFIGYKKADNKIIVLEICEDSKRSSATSRKCRCSKAKVLKIENLNGKVLDISSVPSDYDKSFVYQVGEIVEVKDFDENRWNECSTGIHFFITKKEAVEYE